MFHRLTTDGHSHPPADDHLRHQADLDLSRRAIHGVWTSLLIVIVLALFTSCFTDQPRIGWIFIAAMALIVGLRLGCRGWPNQTSNRSLLFRKRVYLSTI